MTAPPMPYSGGKQRIAEQIVSLFPAHQGYVEPFAGALSVLLAKEPVRFEVVNDLDGDIVAFWRVLRDHPDDLERVCALTPHSRLETQLSGQREQVTDLERARRVWVCLTQRRAAVMRGTAGWRFTYSSNGTPLTKYLTGYLGRIAPAAERLRSVSLECRPAIDVIRQYGQNPDILLYLDPPYLGDTRSMSRGQYVHEMQSEEEHVELLEAAVECAANVAISGYPHPLYDRYLSGWERVEIAAKSAMGADRTEVVWTNYQPQPTLLEAL